MVGNVYEWVAEWVPLSTTCPTWGAFSNDQQCFAGADTTADLSPGALLRGVHWGGGTLAGPLAVYGRRGPFFAGGDTGFRCAR
jgi:formylglycine-generating enzyme required for sulfatase activity